MYLEDDDDEGGAPIAEISRSPMRRSRRSSFGDVEGGWSGLVGAHGQRSRRGSIEQIPASPRLPPDMYHVISVAAFKE